MFSTALPHLGHLPSGACEPYPHCAQQAAATLESRVLHIQKYCELTALHSHYHKVT